MASNIRLKTVKTYQKFKIMQISTEGKKKFISDEREMDMSS